MAISASSGVTSGIDYQSLITQLVGIKRQSVTALEKTKKGFEDTRTAFETLGKKLTALSTAASDLKSATGFSVFNTDVTDSTVLAATATSSASYGTFSVRVDAIANAHKMAADGVAADTTVVAAGAGSFSFQVGAGTVQTVAVDATTTITGLKDAINALNAGVTASVVNDGSPTNPYRLILSSNTTGTANAITITQNDTSLLFSTTLQAAQDASVNVDGMQYTRSTNTISDIITGVNLELKSANPAQTVTLAVSRNTDEITKKIQAFVDGYNGVVDYIKSKNRYDKDLKVAGEFFGDSVARSVWEDLRRTMTGAVAGLPSDMNRLLHAGITSDSFGKMTLDSTKLTDALASDFDGVVSLFKDDPASTKGFGGLIYDLADSMTNIVDGRIKNKQDGLSKSIKRIDMDMIEKESALALYEDNLRAQFTGLETMLASLKSQSSFLMNL
ncbi:MAG: flagellar filament capping protein FliD [Thermodesulfobacteriota bacterium]